MNKKDTYFEDKVMDYYKTKFPKKILDKIIIVTENERLDSDFVPPTSYYIIDYFGYLISFKTIKREIAQKLSDTMYGCGVFTTKKYIKAEVR